MMPRKELEFDIREIMNEQGRLSHRMGACQRIYDCDRAQRQRIEALEQRTAELLGALDAIKYFDGYDGCYLYRDARKILMQALKEHP